MDYLEWFQQRSPHLSRFHVELTVLRLWDQFHAATKPSGVGKLTIGELWRSWKRQKWMHRAACIAEWTPETDQHEWFLEMLQAADFLEQPEERGMHFIGSKDSGKSEVMAILAIQWLLEDPAYTSIYVGGPYKQATQMGIWTNLLAAYALACPFMGWDYDDTISGSPTSRIDLDLHPKAGFIQMTGVDKIGMLQGKKPRSPNRGWLFVILDESGVMPSKASQQFMDLLGNILRRRSRILSACNFKSIHGLDGQLCKPRGRSWDSLHEDRDFKWRAEKNAMVYRFDGYRSPNVLAGFDKFPYLIKKGDIDQALEDYGPKHPKFLEQVRSFPSTSGEWHYITTMEKIRMGGAFHRPAYTGASVRRFAFTDPSQGGDSYHLVMAEEKTAHENGVERKVLVPLYSGHAPLEKDKLLDTNTLAKIRSLAPDLREFSPGVPIRPGIPFPAEWQGALWVSEKLREYRVPAAHCGWDGTMRATISRACTALIGIQSLGLDFGSPPPEEFSMPSRIGLAKDLYRDMQTFLWHLSAEMLELGLWREMERIARAPKQLTDRLWEQAGTRRKLEDKQEFIKRNANESPNEQDAFAGICYVAHIRGAARATSASIDKILIRNAKPQPQPMNR